MAIEGLKRIFGIPPVGKEQQVAPRRQGQKQKKSKNPERKREGKEGEGKINIRV